jgi:hypothetical protein
MESNKQSLPQARVADLVTRDLPDEVLVYDLKRHKAHCLNQTAALIWKYCDGSHTIKEIATLVEKDMNAPVSEEVIWHGIDRLNKANLLLKRIPPPVDVSRRKLLGLAATLSLPMVVSIVAPTAAQAATCGPPNNTVNANGLGCPCMSNMACGSTCCGFGPGGNPVCVLVNSVAMGGMCIRNCECAGMSMCVGNVCA